jgi:hypothetical protein
VQPVPRELLIRGSIPSDSIFCYDVEMRDLLILFVHVIATPARLLGPGGIRSVVAESILVKQQLLILNRSRQRSPNLRTSDRLVAGLCALLIPPARLVRSAVVLKPSTLLSFHHASRNRKYRLLFSITIDGNPTAEASFRRRWLPDSPNPRVPCGRQGISANRTSNETSSDSSL